MGLTPSTAEALLAAGVDVITSGNHIWDKREIYPYLEPNERVLRPLNYGTHEVPGRGWGVYQRARRHRRRGHQPPGPHVHAADREPVHRCRPAARRVVRAAAARPPRRLPLRADLGEERARALPRRAGQRVVGTHTHVVTGDERILPNGTAYQTDIGMTGPIWSVIGFEPRTVLPRFINALPTRFEVGEGPVVFNAVQIDIDPATGRALADRADPAPRRGVAAWARPGDGGTTRCRPRPRVASCRPGPPRSTSTRTRPARTASWRPPSSCRRLRRPASGSSASPTTTRSPATARVVADGRGAGRD